jgi:hypothetical protein
LRKPNMISHHWQLRGDVSCLMYKAIYSRHISCTSYINPSLGLLQVKYIHKYTGWSVIDGEMKTPRNVYHHKVHTKSRTILILNHHELMLEFKNWPQELTLSPSNYLSCWLFIKSSTISS